MRARHLIVPVAAAALGLAATPLAPAVTIAPKLLAPLTVHPLVTHPAVAARKDKLRSCQVGDKNRAHTRSAGRAGETERRGATVACEQPPRSTPNLPGLAQAQTSAILAAG
jgi:hypothetical protein